MPFLNIKSVLKQSVCRCLITKLVDDTMLFNAIIIILVTGDEIAHKMRFLDLNE